jgi:hypothetical protein
VVSGPIATFIVPSHTWYKALVCESLVSRHIVNQIKTKDRPQPGLLEYCNKVYLLKGAWVQTATTIPSMEKKLDQGEKHPFDFILKKEAPPNLANRQDSYTFTLLWQPRNHLPCFNHGGGHITMQHHGLNPDGELRTGVLNQCAIRYQCLHHSK